MRQTDSPTHTCRQQAGDTEKHRATKRDAGRQAERASQDRQREADDRFRQAPERQDRDKQLALRETGTERLSSKDNRERHQQRYRVRVANKQRE